MCHSGIVPKQSQSYSMSQRAHGKCCQRHTAKLGLLGSSEEILPAQEPPNCACLTEKRHWRSVMRQLVRCCDGIFCCKRQKCVKVLRMENNEQQRVESWTGQGWEDVSYYQEKQSKGDRNHGKEPWKYKRRADVWCTRSQGEREAKTHELISIWWSKTAILKASLLQ